MTIAISQTVFRLPSFLKNIRNEYGRFKHRILVAGKRRAIYRETKFELGVLTDRQLADIGIPRCMIPRLAMDAALKELENETL